MERKVVSSHGKLSISCIATLVAGFTSILGVVTGLCGYWIETLFGIDPDHHSGSTEWDLVIACALSAIVFFTLAHHSWRKQLPT
ncbi:MAG TPA: hypothetical protein VF283_05720 [Bryobacteraceae bacterium]